jgi:uncharacterized protein
MTQLNDNARTEIEAAAFRRLIEHLRTRSDVQNIDLMTLAGFCRNCLANWYREATEEKGISMSKEESREIVYGMPYDQWREKHQREAAPEAQKSFERNRPSHD